MSALTRHVSVRDEVGVIHEFGPDSPSIPDWAARKITNPAAWADGEVPFPAAPVEAAGPNQGAVSAVPTVDLEDRIVSRVLDGVGQLLRDMLVVVDDEGGDGSEAVPPPRAGKGSGEDKWRAYAAEKGVDVSHIEDRNEIIAFLEEQGVPVE